MTKRIRIYHTDFGKYVPSFLRIKNSEGFDIKDSCRDIEYFLDFLNKNYKGINKINKQIILRWISEFERLSPSSFNNRISNIDAFLRFLWKNGIDCPERIGNKEIRRRRSKYVPYIFSESELVKIIRTVDCYPPSNVFTLRHLSLPLVFRCLINFGLRASEVCNIRVSDVLDRKIIIKDAKSKSFRLIPISESFYLKLLDYIKQVFSSNDQNEYLFLYAVKRRITPHNLYGIFRLMLRKAGIKHKGRGQGPRIIDFRHTYCVTRIKLWLKEGRDLTEIGPYLSRFLGHRSFSQTAYYFSFVADLFDDFRKIENKLYKGILPNIDWEYDYENEVF